VALTRRTMDDLDRLFRHLVNHLASADPERLRAPFEIAELYQSLIPYRSHRRPLKVDSIEDYDMALLRLLSGERGYAAVEPVHVQEALVLESESVNPNPGAFRDFAAATVRLSHGAVRSVLDQQAAYAPPERASEESKYAPPPIAEPVSPPEPTPSGGGGGLVFEAVEVACPRCGEELPGGRRVIFCPFCGRQLEESRCPQCGDPLEPGWRFCGTCGSSVSE
jgi:hypothetical protein